MCIVLSTLCIYIYKGIFFFSQAFLKLFFFFNDSEHPTVIFQSNWKLKQKLSTLSIKEKMIWHVILCYLLFTGGRRWLDEKHLKQKKGKGGSSWQVW